MRLLLLSLSLFLICGCQHPAHRHERVARSVRQKQLFVVIDDAGLALSETQQFLDLPVALTLAVLPHQKQTAEVCDAILRSREKELILHQPMEAYNADKNPGPGAIRRDTPPAEVSSILDRNLTSVQGARGMNNHMGSLITEDPELMSRVLRYCKDNGLFFLDSKTAYNSVAGRAASREHMHIEQRHVFLDIQHDREYVRNMWGHAVDRANKQGYAVVIGHAWCPETAAVIRDSFQTLQNQGYTFHLLSELYE